MKLTVIVDSINNREVIPIIRELTKQKTDNVELLLINTGTQNVKSEVIDTVLCKGLTHEEAIAKAVKKAKGDYVAVVMAGDTVSDDYIEQIINRTNGNPDKILVKWKYENWHDLTFVGTGTYFSDVIKRNATNYEKINKIDKIIYFHLR